jgi:two-component system chemotaxis response regulator CheB
MTPRTLQRRVDAIVIGASAGGIEALSVLLPALPPQLSVPVFAVLHLPREHRSLLTQIFQPKCARPVLEAQDKEPIAAGVIYFAPPDYHLLIDDGPQLALSADEPVNFSRPSIDVLFESAAEQYGSRLAAILLTGANQDGAHGLAAVQQAGGVVIVQDPEEAQVPTMIEAALSRTQDPWILPLAGIALLMSTIEPGDAA